MEKHLLNYLMKYAKPFEWVVHRFHLNIGKCFSYFCYQIMFFLTCSMKIFVIKKFKNAVQVLLAAHRLFCCPHGMSSEMYMRAFGNLQLFMPKTSAENHCEKTLLHCF